MGEAGAAIAGDVMPGMICIPAGGVLLRGELRINNKACLSYAKRVPIAVSTGSYVLTNFVNCTPPGVVA